jgi:hypothetical protein
MTKNLNDQKNPDQQTKLSGVIPEIVKNGIEDISTGLPSQKAPGFRREPISDYARMQAASWAADMYDICGGDGEGNAYLGDGLSITPDGQITDD